jgi:hypothetical protein
MPASRSSTLLDRQYAVMPSGALNGSKLIAVRSTRGSDRPIFESIPVTVAMRRNTAIPSEAKNR